METTTMIDREGVLRHATVCANSHGREVRSALNAFMCAATPQDTAFTTQRLRDALVLQAAGHEPGAHDGSTYSERVHAARLALEAWDGPEEVRIQCGGVVVCCARETARNAGFSPGLMVSGVEWADDRTQGRPSMCLQRALSEGLRGEAAVRRVVVLRLEEAARSEAYLTAKHEENAALANKAAAGMNLAAEREISRRQNR